MTALGIEKWVLKLILAVVLGGILLLAHRLGLRAQKKNEEIRKLTGTTPKPEASRLGLLLLFAFIVVVAYLAVEGII